MRRFRVLFSVVFCVLLLCGYAGALDYVGPPRELPRNDPDKEELAALTPEIQAVLRRFSPIPSDGPVSFVLLDECSSLLGGPPFGEGWVGSISYIYRTAYKVYVGLDEGFLLQNEIIVRLDGGNFRLNTADAPYVWVLPFYNRTGTLTIVLQKGALAGGLNAFGGPLSGEQLAKLAENPDAWIIGAVRLGPRDTFYNMASEKGDRLSGQNFTRTKVLYLAFPTLEKMAVAALTPEDGDFLLLRDPLQWSIREEYWAEYQQKANMQAKLLAPESPTAFRWPYDAFAAEKDRISRQIGVGALLALAAGIGGIALTKTIGGSKRAGRIGLLAAAALLVFPAISPAYKTEDFIGVVQTVYFEENAVFVAAARERSPCSVMIRIPPETRVETPAGTCSAVEIRSGDMISANFSKRPVRAFRFWWAVVERKVRIMPETQEAGRLR